MKKVLTAFLIISICYSCSNSISYENSPQKGYITLTMPLSSIKDALRISIDSIGVAISGPSQIKGQLLISSDSTFASGLFNNLITGDYLISVIAFSNKDSIATGNGSAKVSPGKTTNVKISMRLLTGNLTILVNWIPSDGLVAYFPFNGNANDESGNGHNGNVNKALLTADRYGIPNKAYLFNDSTSYIVISNSNSLLPDNGSFTISFWVYFISLGSGAETWVLDIDDGNSDYSGYGFYLTHSDTTLDAYWHYDDSWTHHTDTYTKVKFNQWNFITAILDRSGNSANLYLNGDLIDTKSLDNNSITAWSDLYLGKRRYVATGSAQLSGKMDDIRLYNRALSPEEVNELFNE